MIADSVTGARKSCSCYEMLFESSLGSTRRYHIYVMFQTFRVVGGAVYMFCEG